MTIPLPQRSNWELIDPSNRHPYYNSLFLFSPHNGVGCHPQCTLNKKGLFFHCSFFISSMASSRVFCSLVRDLFWSTFPCVGIPCVYLAWNSILDDEKILCFQKTSSTWWTPYFQMLDLDFQGWPIQKNSVDDCSNCEKCVHVLTSPIGSILSVSYHFLFRMFLN